MIVDTWYRIVEEIIEMPDRQWTTQDCGFESLRVPAHSQPEEEAECVVYTIWMVANYIGNEYPNRTIREETTIPKIDEIKDIIQPDNLGWRPNQADLTELSAHMSTVHLSLETWAGTPPRSLIELVETRLEKSLPLIAFVDALQLRRGIRGSGPLHAVVIVGEDNENDEIAIADPWFTAIQAVSSQKLDDAWDPMHHQIIDVDVVQNITLDSGENK